MPEDILIVDNSPANRKLTQRVLAGAGYSAHAVEDAETALQVLPALQPSLVLTDLGLPGMDGFALVRHIKQDPRTQNASVIALTGYSSDEDRRRAMEAGCDDFVMKPIDTRTFPGLVGARLASRPRIGSYAAHAGQFSPSDLPAWAVGLCLEFQRHGGNITREFQEIGTHGDAGAPTALGELSNLHRSAPLWAALAANLGCREIAALAGRLENLLQYPDAVEPAQMGSFVQSLEGSFSRMPIPLESSKASNPLPTSFVERLSGKRVALVGFDPEGASRASDIVIAAGADVLVGESGDMSLCDLVMADGSLAKNRLIQLLYASPTPVLLLGATPGTLPPEALGNSASLDFVSAPWTDEEVAARACRLLTNRSENGADQAGPASRQAPTVVIADDDPTSLVILRSTLESYGVECRTAEEGEQAIKLIQAAPPDVAILDVMMPNMDGFEVLAAIRNDKSLNNVRIIMLTALQQESDIVRGFGLGADDYVIKPFSPVEIYARLKRFLRK